MSQNTPWSQEEAEEWADEYVSGWWAEPLVQARARVDFKAGLAKAAEVIAKSPTECELVKVIEVWKHAWMNVKGTDEADASNYFERAFGIDANMKYDLARRLVRMKQPEKKEG